MTKRAHVELSKTKQLLINTVKSHKKNNNVQ